MRFPRGRRDGQARRFRWKREPDPYLLLVERRALREPVVIETDPSGRARPTGFWRGLQYHHIVKILERRWERGESYVRVLADRGCFDLRHVTDIDPWTWRAQGRWELVAELQAIPLQRRFS